MISCLMPTISTRARWQRQAIRCWQDQDWPSRELIIIEDGSEPMAERIVRELGDPRITYLWQPGSIGAKLNAGAGISTGQLLARWDDDDYHASWRLSYQAQALLLFHPASEICGIDRVIMLEVSTGQLWLYQHTPGGLSLNYLVGGTAVFRRETWESRPFPDISLGEDNAFLRDRRILNLANERFYLATIHEDNSSPRRLQSENYETWPGPLEALIPADHLDFYYGITDAPSVA